MYLTSFVHVQRSCHVRERIRNHPCTAQPAQRRASLTHCSVVARSSLPPSVSTLSNGKHLCYASAQ
jgi:hypothetical protein